MPISQITSATGGIVLTSASYYNPVTVTASGAVDGTAGYGVSAAATWTIENYGFIGGGDAIRFSAGGTVENEADGTIGGNVYGVYISGGAGTVDNAGFIYAGVRLTGGGLVSNAAGAYIYNNGVDITGGPGTVLNAGYVYGGGYAVNLTGGGLVSNAAGGSIHGDTSDGVHIAGSPGTVENAGTITGFNGVELTAGGLVSNAAGGVIKGPTNYGVEIAGGVGTVGNSGSISGYTGVDLAEGGTVSNIGGVIKGVSYDGVAIVNATGSVENSGSIYGFDAGIAMNAGGYARNEAAGQIRSDHVGVDIYGGPGMVTNAGSIYGHATGVYLDGGYGTVENTGTIASKLFGVELGDGGLVSNATGGKISGSVNGGVYVAGQSGTVENSGSISGGVYGVDLTAGGVVSNAGAGTITGAGTNGVEIGGDGGTVVNAGHVGGYGAGVYISGGAGTVENSGSIVGGFYGVALTDGGYVANTAGGLISGVSDLGVYIGGASGTVINAGSILSNYYGVRLTAGGYLGNAAGGTIAGYNLSGVYIGGAAGTMENAGTITGGQDGVRAYGVAAYIGNSGSIHGGDKGVYMHDGGAVTNAAGGAITSDGNYGVEIFGANGTVENAGQISGGLYSVYLDASISNTLIVDAGASFSAAVFANGAAANVLELTSSASAGTLSGLGSAYINFQTLEVDTGAAWTVMGTQFGFSGVKIDFNTSDTLDIVNLGYTTGETAVINPTSYLLTIYNGASPVDTLQFSGAYTGEFFHVSSDGATGTDITLSDSPACYCRGTRVRTDRGQVAVEDLNVGDFLVTLPGELRPIKWIGRRSYAGWLAVGNPDVQPVLFKAGALADHVPSRDLMVSPEHAMYLDGALIPARHLVNGLSIIQTKGMEEIHYFHLELEEHAVIFAEDAASETYVDEGNRGMFHNVYDYYAEFPDAPRWPDARYCAPRIEDGYELDAVRRVLAARATRLRPDGTAAPAPELRGRLERVTRTAIEGWALTSDALVILDNGAVIGGVVPDASHVFRFAIPNGFCPEFRHAIEVRRECDWTLLAGSGILVEPGRALAA